MAQSVPEQIGKYKIAGEIARGGMGVVYKAMHPSLKRYVIIKKMIARGNRTEALRFEQEAKILLDLQNPYIVHLHDYFTEGGYRYMVEELVDGMAVDKLLKKQEKLSVPAALTIILDVCMALRYAHSKHIVHRDIKGGNVLISKRCEIKLADFGIAAEKSNNTIDEEGITQNGAVIGTPSYMPPEQFENSATVDNRADIYALGVMLYELVTGEKPYKGVYSLEMLKIIQKGRYTPPNKINPQVPTVVCHLIKKMMAPKVSNRYSNVEPIIKTIQNYLKNYDTREVRVGIARMVINEQKVTEPQYKQKSKVLQTVAKAIAITAAVGVAFYFCWTKGYIHRYILRKFYTPVQVSVSLPTKDGRAMDIPVFVYFFKNDNASLPLVASTSIQGKATDKSKTLLSPYVYLLHGDYRIKLVTGSYVWWQSFTVTQKDKVLDCDFLQNIKRPIKVFSRVTDYDTGENITSRTLVEVNYQGLWMPLASLSRDKIMNNAVWKFRFSAKGYQTEEFSLIFDWYQDELHIGANLKKKVQ